MKQKIVKGLKRTAKVGGLVAGSIGVGIGSNALSNMVGLSHVGAVVSDMTRGGQGEQQPIIIQANELDPTNYPTDEEYEYEEEGNDEFPVTTTSQPRVTEETTPAILTLKNATNGGRKRVHEKVEVEFPPKKIQKKNGQGGFLNLRENDPNEEYELIDINGDIDDDEYYVDDDFDDDYGNIHDNVDQNALIDNENDMDIL